MAEGTRTHLWLVVLIAVIVLGGLYVTVWRGGEERLTVYCAHDSVYADAVLRRFEEETGIPIAVRYDTEATKSLGLVEMLIREREDPRCDVFWNNELLGTLDLQDRGVLATYRGPGWERIPDGFKDPEGHWTGFGARLRVYIVNTDRMEATAEAVDERMAAQDLSGVAIAKPLYGTTLTHYSVLWHRWGPDRLKAWHADLRDRGVREVDSNGTSKRVVSEGICAMGFTDTDDFFLAKDAEHPVDMVPVRLEDGATICIPNTVAMIQGTDKREAAQKLVDYLLSAETELELARSSSRQIPLGPVDPQKLPDEVRALAEMGAQGVELNDLLEARNACLAWLKSEYVE